MAGRSDGPNLIGHSLDKGIVEQFKQRAQRLSQMGVRSGDNLLDTANNNCWVRLSSFVSVGASGIKEISNGIRNEFPIQAGTAIAQQWALKAEQRQEGRIRYGASTPGGAYGSGGILELGYRPMPGIKSVSVESQPPLGALRSANVAIKAWNLNQLSMIDILYFRLGFSMLLEWGHSVFTNNKGELIHNVVPLDIFSKNSALDTKEEVLRALEKKRKQYSYNYDGMLGIVTNYEWTQAQDGSYDCSLKLTGIGSVIESLKINTQDAAPGTPAPAAPTTPTTPTSAVVIPVAPPPAPPTPSSTTTVQTAVADESSLSAFLSRVQSAYAVDLLAPDFWKNLYSSGLNLLNVPTDAFQYGYNTKYMADGGGGSIPKADLTKIADYGAGKFEIIQLNPDGTPAATTTARFITLASLLAYMNNSCLIYDKSAGTSKPAIYIDFNQETNFCLRLPQQFSVDPGVCLVDVNATDTDYNELFSIKGVDISKITSPSTPTNGAFAPKISGLGYIDSTNAHRGKFMNILVNVDCIKATLQENTDSDKNVFLSKFLSALMTKIQTALGNINVFQIGYDETANTIVIYDAQIVDMDNRTDPIPTLPVFGLKSIVRDYNLKTEASTKIGSMLAITARAGARNTGTNKDSSAFTALNQSLSDRLFKDVSTSPTNTAADAQPVGSTTGVEDLANTFNQQVGKLYETTTTNITYDVASVEAIKNYYIDAMLQIKGKSNTTSGKIDSVAATGILPLALNMTVDGIGGIPLYQAFTLPSDRIPVQYLKNSKPRIAFTIAGVNHTIENNQWTTAIRGLMINIPNDRRVYTPTYTPPINKKANTPPTPPGGDPPLPPVTPGTVGCSTAAKIKKLGFIPVEKSLNTFEQVFNAVVKNIEGGYYHPDMQVANPTKFAAMLSSGETMYGIDRKAGAPATSTCAACTNKNGTGFWDLIGADKAKNPSTWKYAYLPPLGTPLQIALYKQALAIQKPNYEAGYNRSVDPQLKKIIESDGRLWFHYVDAYAWNGGGWAKGFNRIVTAAWKAGETDAYKLAQILTAEKKSGGYNAFKLGTGKNLGASSAKLLTQRGKLYEQFTVC